MFTFIYRALAGTLLLASCAHAASVDGPITVAPDITYVRGPEAAAPVFGPTCNWQKEFMTELVKLSRSNVTVSTTPDPAEQLFLRADHSTPGANDAKGSKAQPQWIEIMGKLVRKGRTVGEFSFIQETDKQALSSCEATRDIAKDLADNVYDWLKNPGAGVTVAAETPMLKPDTVEPDVQATCPATRLLPRELASESDGAVQRTTRDLSTVGGRTLHLKIVSSRLLAGSVYTGAKWLKVTGSLMEEQREIGSFIALRSTVRTRTSCAVLSSVSEEISEDIVKWLKKPSLNARLGNADEKTTAEP